MAEATAQGRGGMREIVGDRRVQVVLATILVTMMGFGIVAPILPLFAQSFGVGYSDVGVLVASFAVTRLAFDLVAGPLVDRYGERMMLTVGMAFLAGTTVLLARAPTFTWAVVFRGAGGAGSALLFAALYSSYLKIVPHDRLGRAFGIFYGMFNVGMIAGQSVGALIVGVSGSLTLPLYAYAAACVLAGVLFLSFAGQLPRSEIVDRVGLRGVRTLMKERAFVTAIVANLAGFWIIGGVWSTLIPLFGHDALGMSAAAIGSVLSIAIGAEFVTLYPFGAVADKHGRRLLLIASLAAYAIAVVALGYATTVLSFTLLLVVLGVASGAGSTAPTAILADVTPKDFSGTAVGAFRFFGDLGFVLGPALAGWAATAFGFRGAFALSALPLLFAFVLAVRTPETHRQIVAAAGRAA
jgi:DHA1 family multidrug resistance protein-like MFS transporter